MLLTIAIFFLIGVAIFRFLRPLFWVVLALVGVGLLITHINIHNASLATIKPVVQLIGHFAWKSIKNGMGEYSRWGHRLSHRL